MLTIRHPFGGAFFFCLLDEQRRKKPEGKRFKIEERWDGVVRFNNYSFSERENGYELNADINGALNILCKSNLLDCKILQVRGSLARPSRIRVK
ncbi:hypothetical protein BLL40_07165 [Domibacillus mangrovi]|uniref:Transposase n=1 Tax=Domibacillus mangrovi TaxID=1714354 RepID=A0A1Q5P540_9BACI|nr:hypothetical protein BLL40_07165 [Domibacillus mangrovi]